MYLFIGYEIKIIILLFYDNIQSLNQFRHYSIHYNLMLLNI